MLLVILSLAAVAILAGVVFAALGRAGEMATFPGDGPPLELDDVTPADVALLRPPMAFWGYYVPAVEEALQLIARSVTARDAEIAALRREVEELRGGAGAPGDPAAFGGAGSPEGQWDEPGKPWTETGRVWPEPDETWAAPTEPWAESGDGETWPAPGAGEAGAEPDESGAGETWQTRGSGEAGAERDEFGGGDTWQAPGAGEAETGPDESGGGETPGEPVEWAAPSSPAPSSPAPSSRAATGRAATADWPGSPGSGPDD